MTAEERTAVVTDVAVAVIVQNPRRAALQGIGATPPAARQVGHQLVRGIPGAEEDVTEAAPETDRAVTAAPAAKTLPQHVKRARALEPHRQAATQLLFAPDIDFGLGGREVVVT